jgi:AcrR family transcriptional regulator
MVHLPTETRRVQIAEAAIRILALEGARKLTAQRLAAEIGVTAGALFRHFRNMDQILDAVVDRVEEVLFAGVAVDIPDPLARLGAFFERRACAILDQPQLSRILLSDHLAQAAGARRAQRIEGFKLRTRQFVVDCLREAKRNGTLAPGVSPETGAVLVVGAVLALSQIARDGRSKTRTRKLTHDAWRALEQLFVSRP